MPTTTSTVLRLGGVLSCAAALAAPLALVHPVAAEAATAAVEHGPVATSTRSVDAAGVDRRALGALRAEQGAAAAPAVLTDRTETRDDFDVVGVTWTPDATVGVVTVRVRLLEDGAWSGWEALPVEDGGPDPGSPEALAAAGVVGTAPLVTDGADGYQVRVDTTSGQSPDDVEVRLVDGGDGDVAASEAQMGTQAAAAAATARGSATAASLRPTVVTRKQWGADESLARGTSSRNTRVKAMVVHHTASSNSYSTAGQALTQLRGIYAYHTSSLGWADIGYNFVVDKFGTIYEGRRGSITENVRGAHASGFNVDTMGVSAIGNYESAAPSSAMVRSIAKVVAWKLAENGVSPTSTTSLTSAGGGTSRYSKGRVVTMPTVLRHMDVGFTACPGVKLSAQMSSIRSQAGQMIAAGGTPTAPAVPSPPASAPVAVAVGAQTLVGDWDGDGRDQVGLYVDGRVSLRRADGSVLRYDYGPSGAVAVVGDWDGDGKDTVGVFRRGQWFLKDSLSGGAADRTFWLGQSGDVPVVGRWDGRNVGVGVYRQGRWMLRKYASAGPVHVSLDFGRASDRPLPGDWDGDGADTPGLQRGQYRFVRPSLHPGPAAPVVFGRSSMVGFAADVDGDRRDGWGVRSGSSFMFRPDTRGGTATSSLVFAG